MRRLVSAVVLSLGLLTGCGGTAGEAVSEPLGDIEQGLACRYPEMSCPNGTICVYDYELCRPPCPSTGVCAGGTACRVSPSGQKHC